MFNFLLKRATYQAVRQPIQRYCNYVSLHSAHDGQGGGGAGVITFREYCAELEKARRGWDEQRRQENDQLLDRLQTARRQENDQLLDRLQKAADDHSNLREKLRSEIGDLKV
jgi:arginine utilization protein RocB